jgi:hypothetical protein
VVRDEQQGRLLGGPPQYRALNLIFFIKKNVTMQI